MGVNRARLSRERLVAGCASAESRNSWMGERPPVLGPVATPLVGSGKSNPFMISKRHPPLIPQTTASGVMLTFSSVYGIYMFIAVCIPVPLLTRKPFLSSAVAFSLAVLGIDTPPRPLPKQPLPHQLPLKQVSVYS